MDTHTSAGPDMTGETVEAVATSERASGFPIEPIKIFGKKAYPLEATEQYVTTLRTAYDSLQSEYAGSMTSMQRMEAMLETERRLAAKYKSEVSEVKARAELSEAECETMLKRMAQLEQDAEQAGPLLEEKSRRVAQLEDALAEKNTAVSRYADEIAELRKENAQLKEAAKMAPVNELEALTSHFEAELSARDAIILAKNDEIVEISEKLAHREAEISHLEERQYEIIEGTEIMMSENNNSLAPAEFSSQIVDIWGTAQSAADDYVLQVKEHMDKRLTEAEQQADEMIVSAKRERDEILQEAQEQAEALMSETTVDADAKRQKAEMVLRNAEEKAAEIVAAAQLKAAELKAEANQELSTINQLIAASSARYQEISAQKAQEFLG